MLVHMLPRLVHMLPTGVHMFPRLVHMLVHMLPRLVHMLPTGVHMLPTGGFTCCLQGVHMLPTVGSTCCLQGSTCFLDWTTGSPHVALRKKVQSGVINPIPQQCSLQHVADKVVLQD